MGRTRILHPRGKVLFRKAIVVATVSAACMALTACADSPRDDARRGKGGQACSDGTYVPGFFQAQEKADRAFRKALREGNPDPVVEARKAADRGDFRLAGRMTIDGINTEAYGARCRLMGGLAPWTSRVIEFTQNEGQKPASADLVAFASVYNATVMADPRYPYDDVCRAYAGKPEAEDNAAHLFEPGYRAYGYPELKAPPKPSNIWQAARRGSIARLRLLLRAGADIDRPDIFGMSPLAWSVAYRRWPAADFLLSQGASPSGSKCQGLVDRDSPMQIARTMRWGAMIWRMRPLVTEDDFASLRQLPRAHDLGIDAFNKSLTDLRGTYRADLVKVPFGRHEMIIAVDPEGKSLECRLDPGTGIDRFDAALCQRAIEVLRWTPARDAFGIAVAADAKLVLGLGDKP